MTDESLAYFLKKHKNFWALLILGNIENLVLASQGSVRHLNPFILGALTITMVTIWFLIGTYGTRIAIKYENVIQFIGGLAIFILGLQSMTGAVGI